MTIVSPRKRHSTRILPMATAPAKTTAAKKTAAEKTDAFAFGSFPFDASKFEMPAAFQQMAETNVKTSKEAYEKMKVAAEETTAMIEDTMEKTKAGVADMNNAAFEAAKSNTEAAFDMISKLFAVKSPSEAIELQTAFASKQYEVLSAQAKDLQEKGTKFIEETTAPYKAAAEKAMADFKVA